MSWTIGAIGTPEDVFRQIEVASTSYSGQSKKELDGALPHILGIVKQNFGIEGRQIKVSAYGHGTVGYPTGEGETEINRVCTVTVTEWDPLV